MTAQRSEAWLKAATPEQIAAAYDAGELEAVQRGESIPAVGD